MNKSLEIKFGELEKRRAGLSGQLEILAEDKLGYRVKPDKWSINQIVFHLIKSEQLTLVSFNKNMTDEEKLKKSGIMGKTMHLGLSLALKSSFKFKAPEMLSGTQERHDIKGLMKKWDTIRKNFAESLGKFPDSMFDRAVFKHPKAGWLNVEQMLDFLRDHFDHHNRQIKNLIDLQDNN